MSCTTTFSLLIGFLYLVVGLGMFISRDSYLEVLTQWKSNAVIIYLGGVLAFVFGYVILIFHAYWGPNPKVLVTLFGCLAIIKGIGLLLAPNLLKELCNFKNLDVIRIVAVIVGLLFIALAVVYA